MVQTALGVLGLHWQGPESPERARAILFHGFPDTAASWVPVQKELASRGIESAAVTMPGYGSKLLGVPNLANLGRMVHEVTRSLISDVPLVVVGHDWGAAAVWSAATQSERKDVPLAHGICLISVPPPALLLRSLLIDTAQRRRSAYMFFFQLPLLPELAVSRGGLVEALWRRWSPRLADRQALAAARRRLSDPEAARQALDYYRALFRPMGDVGGWLESWRLIGCATSTRAQVLTGMSDGCIGPRCYSRLSAAFRGSWQLEVVPQAGHWLPLEEPAAVALAVERLLV